VTLFPHPPRKPPAPLPSSKQERIDEAWRAYLSASRSLPRSLSWPDFCARDSAMFDDYLAVERAILSEKGGAP
jgi:hypothetical protein